MVEYKHNYNKGKYKIHLHSLRNSPEKLVEMNFIFVNNVSLYNTLDFPKNLKINRY
jgi:hypothetical protein